MATQRLQYLLLLLILLLAFALRVYRIDASALRGDEAFAVRYWAAPPSEVLVGLAWVEPHPFGTFFGFWAWKSLVGETELAMRMLPALLNLLGVAAMYALARRLRMGAWAALFAAFLWAVNPGLIWHSQDVRNYAPWAGLSAVALWLLVRAADKNSRVDWVLYVVVEVITLYVFFLEAFMLLVHGLYVLWVAWDNRAQGDARTAWASKPHATTELEARERGGARSLLRSSFASAVAIGVLLMPWFYQAYRLAGSGYGGTAERANPFALLGFVAEWIALMPIATWGSPIFAMILFPLVASCTVFLFVANERSSKLIVLMLITLPVGLTVAASQLDVFRARYLLAIMPAFFLLFASFAHQRLLEFRRIRPYATQFWSYTALTTTVVVVLAGITQLLTYYGGALPKAPDWRAICSVLRAEVKHTDALVVAASDNLGSIDPAFDYYCRVFHVVLPTLGVDTDYELQRLLNTHRNVFVLEQGSAGPYLDVGNSLHRYAVDLGRMRRGGLWIAQYRSRDLQPNEIQREVDLILAGGRIEGWSVEGVLRQGDRATLLVYWATPIEAGELGWKTFVHVVDRNGTIATQVDRPYFASVIREVHPISLSFINPGEYTLRFGLYREATGERAIITDAATGEALGDYVDLGTIRVGAGG